MIRKSGLVVVWLAIIMIHVCSSVSAQVIDRIVAIVNNDIITLVQLNKAILPYKQNIEASQKSEEQTKELIQSLERDILHQMIDRSLTNQEAAKYQINVSDAEVDSAINNFKEKNNLDQKQLEQALEADGIPYKDYRERIKEDILQSMLITRAVRSKVIITQSDIKKYYDENKDKFLGIKKYRLRNILMDNQDKINKVKRQLEKNASFQELAKEYSIASNASEGGDLGEFDINNFSEAIKTTLEKLGKNDHSSVIQTGQGYQIFYVEDIILEGSKTYDQAQDQIHEILYRNQAERQFKQWIETLKKNAHVKIML